MNVSWVLLLVLFQKTGFGWTDKLFPSAGLYLCRSWRHLLLSYVSWAAPGWKPGGVGAGTGRGWAGRGAVGVSGKFPVCACVLWATYAVLLHREVHSKLVSNADTCTEIYNTRC